jgi:probable addiction module antidote protein
MVLETTPFSLTDLIPDQEGQARVLSSLLTEDGGDTKAFLIALGHLAREKGMTSVAKAVGVTRERLYRSLSGEATPRFSTVVGVLAELGYHVTLTPIARLPAATETSNAAE